MQNKFTQLVTEYPYSIIYNVIRTSSYDPPDISTNMIKTDSFNDAYGYAIQEINKLKETNVYDSYIIYSQPEVIKTEIIAKIKGKMNDLIIKIIESHKLLPSMINYLNNVQLPTIYEKIGINTLFIEWVSDSVISFNIHYSTFDAMEYTLFDKKRSLIDLKNITHYDNETYLQVIEAWFTNEIVINNKQKLNDVLTQKKTAYFDKNDLTLDKLYEDVIIEFNFYSG